MADLKALLEKKDGILMADPGAYRPILEDLQGNILQSHGRGHAHYLFVRFKAGDEAVQAARGWLRELQVTSELGEIDSQRTDLFTSLLLTSAGYRALGIGNAPGDAAFQAGMRQRAGKLGDRSYQWEPEYGEGEIHALLLLAHRDAGALEAAVEASRNALSAMDALLKEEHGDAIPVKGPAGDWFIEPYGYRDGISQPLFYQEAILAKEGADLFGTPKAALDTVLLKDPSGAENGCGSFFVYRKLRQDVAGFYGEIAKLHASQGGVGTDELVLAQIMGRYRDGTPLTPKALAMKAEQPAAAASFNNFDYREDPAGEDFSEKPVCPFHAHIRKNNPRFKSNPLIARRGIPYGPAIDRDKTGRPVLLDGKIAKDNQALESDLGILFLCAQSSIENQFETIQGAWANGEYNPLEQGGHYSGPRGGVDPIGGEPGPIAKGLPFFGDFKFAKTIEVKGGEYFFAPSLSCLRAL